MIVLNTIAYKTIDSLQTKIKSLEEKIVFKIINY